MRIYEASICYSLLALGDPQRINGPQDAVDYLADAFDEDPTVEWFFVILLDQKNHPIGRKAVSRGTANSTLVHAREVFKAAILGGATGVVVGHNHPSDAVPSRCCSTVRRAWARRRWLR